jgi:hypothetical protein
MEVTPMNARQYRSMAERCRDLRRIVKNDEVRAQLRQWEQDFEAEAEAVEEAALHSGPPARRLP